MALLRDIKQLRFIKNSKENIRTLDGRTFDTSIESPLCHYCTGRGIWHHLSGIANFRLADWVFGFIKDPKDVDDPERKECPFCKLVFDALPETAFAEEHRHLYQSEGASKVYCSLRPVKIKVRGEYFTSFVVAYNFLEYTSHSRKIFQNYRAWIGLGSPARRKFNSPGIAPVRTPEILDPTLIQKWINRCQRHHGVCNGKHHTVASMSSWTMMMDIHRSCLVKAVTDREYAALSYCWGQVRTLQTTMANLTALMTPGALNRGEFRDQLPQVIQDCIALVKAIGVPYLWVDCLCIIQDDQANKHEQIARMDSIYLQAKITIIPYAGKNAHAAIPGVRSGTRAMFSSPISSTPCNQSNQTSIVLTASPEWASLEYDAVHESRAWTLQEKVLSLRCLFISRWGMFFQCLSSRYSDVITGELPIEPEDSGEWSLLSLEMPTHLPRDSWEGWDESRIDEFLSFALHVEWYSARKLTFQTDRIDAFTGILNLFRDRCQQDFLWGHPEGRLLPISLLWIHVEVGRSRDAQGAVGGEVTIYQDYLPDRDTEYPTWSWIGWSGRVSYRLVLDLDEAGFDMGLDDDVEIATQPTFDEDNAREKGVDKYLSPDLFYRTMNRGTLELRGPTTSTQDMCCQGTSASLHLTTLDGTFGTFTLTSALYPFYMEKSLTMSTEDMEGKPCGALFGIPFWGREHYDNHKLILLKTVPGDISFLFGDHAGFRRVFQAADRGSVCIGLLIWISGRYAERKGVAILDQTFWDSRNPVVEEYLLL